MDFFAFEIFARRYGENFSASARKPQCSKIHWSFALTKYLFLSDVGVIETHDGRDGRGALVAGAIPTSANVEIVIGGFTGV